MSKDTIILVIIFFLAAITFLVLQKTYFKTPKQDPFSFFASSPTPNYESTLSLEPSFLTALYGEKSTVSVVLDNNKTLASGGTKLVQLEIAFDPDVLGNIQVLPGDIFTNPVVVLNSVNESIGRISYALSVSDAFAGNTKGTIAKISFIPRMNALKNETSLYFLPKTMIKIDDQTNTLQAAYGTKIIFTKGTKSATQSAVTPK